MACTVFLLKIELKITDNSLKAKLHTKFQINWIEKYQISDSYIILQYLPIYNHNDDQSILQSLYKIITQLLLIVEFPGVHRDKIEWEAIYHQPLQPHTAKLCDCTHSCCSLLCRQKSLSTTYFWITSDGPI